MVDEFPQNTCLNKRHFRFFVMHSGVRIELTTEGYVAVFPVHTKGIAVTPWSVFHTQRIATVIVVNITVREPHL